MNGIRFKHKNNNKEVELEVGWKSLLLVSIGISSFFSGFWLAAKKIIIAAMIIIRGLFAPDDLKSNTTTKIKLA